MICQLTKLLLLFLLLPRTDNLTQYSKDEIASVHFKSVIRFIYSEIKMNIKYGPMQ